MRELQGLVDEGIEQGVKEREAARSEDALVRGRRRHRRPAPSRPSPEAQALKNPYDPAKPIYVAGPEAKEPGTVYLDARSAASGPSASWPSSRTGRR